MNASEPAHSVDALSRLEARVRWLMALSSFLTLGLLALGAWQFAPRPKVVEANAFVLRDHQWKRRGEFGLREDGSPMLRLNGVNGHERVMISARDDGQVVFRLSDGKDVYRARFALDESGQPFVLLAGPDGRTRVAFGPIGGAYSGLTLYDGAGKVQWAVP